MAPMCCECPPDQSVYCASCPCISTMMCMYTCTCYLLLIDLCDPVTNGQRIVEIVCVCVCVRACVCVCVRVCVSAVRTKSGNQ